MLAVNRVLGQNLSEILAVETDADVKPNEVLFQEVKNCVIRFVMADVPVSYSVRTRVGIYTGLDENAGHDSAVHAAEAVVILLAARIGVYG
jgi:hypothetical protein